VQDLVIPTADRHQLEVHAHRPNEDPSPWRRQTTAGRRAPCTGGSCGRSPRSIRFL